jgi:hypothetical protein
MKITVSRGAAKFIFASATQNGLYTHGLTLPRNLRRGSSNATSAPDSHSDIRGPCRASYMGQKWSFTVPTEARDAIHAIRAQQEHQMLRNARIWLNWIITLWLIGWISVLAFSAPWRWTTAQRAFVVLCVWGAVVAGIWSWVWLRQMRHRGENEGRTNLRPFWTFVPWLLIGPPACALSIYVIYKFATGSLQGAVIVAAGVSAWITGSIIWVYVIHPKLRGKRDRDPN